MRVLLLDHDTDRATSLARDLQARSITVVIESEGMNGLVRAASEPFDAVLVAATLMGMSGARICTRLEKDGMRVLLVEGSTRAEDLFESLASKGAPASFHSDKPSQVRKKSGTAFSTLRGTLAAHAKPQEPAAKAGVDLVVAKSRARALEHLLQERQAMMTELERANQAARLDRELALRRAEDLAKKLVETEWSLEEARARLDSKGLDRTEADAAVVVRENEREAESDRRAAALQLSSANEARAHAATRKELEELREALATATDTMAARQREIDDLRENHERAVAELVFNAAIERATALEEANEANEARRTDELAAIEQRYVEAAAIQNSEVGERERRAVELQELAETRLREELEAEHVRAISDLQQQHSDARVQLLSEAERVQTELEKLQSDMDMAPALAPRQREADERERWKNDEGIRMLRMDLDRARRDADAAMRASAAEVRALRIREENLVAEITRIKNRNDTRNAELAAELERARAANAAMTADLAALEEDAFRLSQNDGSKLKAQVETLQAECKRLKGSFAMTEASLELAHQEEVGALRAELEAAAKDYAAEVAKARAAGERSKLEAVDDARKTLRSELEEKQRQAADAWEASLRARIDDEVAERREQWTRTLLSSQEKHEEERDALAERVAELVAETSELEQEITVLRGALVAARRKLDLPTPSTG